MRQFLPYQCCQAQLITSASPPASHNQHCPIQSHRTRKRICSLTANVPQRPLSPPSSGPENPGRNLVDPVPSVFSQTAACHWQGGVQRLVSILSSLASLEMNRDLTSRIQQHHKAQNPALHVTKIRCCVFHSSPRVSSPLPKLPTFFPLPSFYPLVSETILVHC